MKVKFYILGIKRNFRGTRLFEILIENGFNAEIVWGFDAQEFSFTDFRDDEKSTFFYRRPLTSGEIACTLGHRLILQKAHLENVEFAIVLEDDVYITNVQEIFSSVTNFSLPSPWLLLLVVDHRLTLNSWFQHYSNRDYNYRKIISNPSPTSAYALNRRAIELLARSNENDLLGFQADFPPNWFRRLKFYELKGAEMAISIVPNESLIPNRQRDFKGYEKSKLRILKLILPSSMIKAKNYDVFLQDYLAHFIGRSIAWRYSKRKAR